MNKNIISEVYLNLKSSYTIQAKMWKEFNALILISRIQYIFTGVKKVYFSLLFKQHISVFLMNRGGLGQNFRPGNLTLIQAIPYTHNKFWNMDNPISLPVWPSHKKV